MKRYLTDLETLGMLESFYMAEQVPQSTLNLLCTEDQMALFQDQHLYKPDWMR